MVGQAILTLGVFRAWNGWTSNTLGVCSEHGMVGLAILTLGVCSEHGMVD